MRRPDWPLSSGCVSASPPGSPCSGGGDTILRTDEPVYGDAHCEGVREVGTRSVVAVGPTRPPHPRTYARVVDGKAVERPVTFEEQFETCKTLIGSWHGSHGGRLNIALITPTLREEHHRDLGEANSRKRAVKRR